MVEGHGIEALEGLVDVTVDLQITGDVGAGETELIGCPGDVVNPPGMRHLKDHLGPDKPGARSVVGLESDASFRRNDGGEGGRQVHSSLPCAARA